MVELQSGLEEIKKEGAVFWAVNYDTLKTLKKVKGQLDVTFPLLSDHGSKTIDLYGVRNKDMDGTKRDGLASPTIFIIDKDSKITTLFSDSVRKRHGSIDIIKALE